MLESAVRNCDKFSIQEQDVNNILHWEINQNSKEDIEIPFKPARVILQVSWLFLLEKSSLIEIKICSM